MAMKTSTPSAGPADLKKLLQSLRFVAETGHIMLFDQRMLLVHGFSLATLRAELIERLGYEMARSLFTRLGYQQGLEDHRRMREAFPDTVDAAVALGPRLRDMEGYQLNRMLELHFDEERGEFYGQFHWENSWEAEAHLKQHGMSATPVCWTDVGYATAFATSAFGKPVLARELQCVAMGHPHCHVVMQPIDAWGRDADDDLSFLQVEDFVDPPRRRQADAGRSATIPIEKVSPLQQELVGASAAFNTVIHMLRRVAQTDATVLFLGESGVGKERFSRTLHEIGPRAKAPFISVNCAAIPQDLVEAELFGVERGAFTGATASRPGRFERAHAGTLFLDEISSLPLPAQGKLLRALQEREVERVGGTQLRKVDVRVVAASNEDLREAVRQGRFRADLYFRLNVFPIRIPPLRERREDIPLLFNVFVERFSRRFDKRIAGISRQALDALWQHDWPGNVRELENMVERAVILADDGKVIDLHHLFAHGEGIKPPSHSPMDGVLDASDESAVLVDRLLDLGHTLADIESSALSAALRRHRGKLAPAARQLGLGRGQMQYKTAKLRLEGSKRSEPEPTEITSPTQRAATAARKRRTR